MSYNIKSISDCLQYKFGKFLKILFWQNYNHNKFTCGSTIEVPSKYIKAKMGINTIWHEFDNCLNSTLQCTYIHANEASEQTLHQGIMFG